MSTIAQLVADISASPAPVVFLDTCAILDVARAPARNQPDSVSAADTLVRLAGQDPPAVFLLITDVVKAEWAEHIKAAQDLATNVVRDYGHVSSVAVLTGLLSAAAPALDKLTFSARLRGLSESVLSAGKVIDRDSQATSAAVDRVVSKRKPSGKKGLIKDCYILEHYLAVARGLGGSAYSRPMEFVSSNTDDFADKPSDDLHADLVADFVAAGLKYDVSLGGAVARLRGEGHLP